MARRKKVPSLLGSEQKKSIRMDTLGDGYTPADLRAVIAGEKAHTPRKSAAAPVKPQKRSGNLLVDIQTKLRAGKGAGYARWATLFNLKQMAQTVAYLQDHELLDYAVLSEKAAAASAHFNELSARIKAAEKRMAEIAVLREHIANYAKTRDTYVAYRKAGYSKKFLAEHELSLIHIYRVELGSDARGNLVRIENALDKMSERLRSVQDVYKRQVI